MTRKAFVETLSWMACLAILLALFLGLDPYRRPSLDYGYGPEIRHYLVTTLERARDLETKGAYRVSPEERWHLIGGWQEALSDATPPRALAVHRRARLVMPVLEPAAVEVRMEVAPIPPQGSTPEPLDLDYGVNGVSVGHVEVPPQGTVLVLRIPSSNLFRGDNTLYLYRITRRPDPGPWLALGTMAVQRVAPSSSD